ncbi:putative RNA recognition motif domain, nucleotide-binding alpha-beta plait domain superfamily [Helianthus annuus]|nr:putative RNA recognition motif domain, nucleotide-binding alpha-beta plait domain superfamily [Helianthus annuus]
MSHRNRRGGGGEWTDVEYRKKRNIYCNQKSQTTFFVTNLPGGISNSLLSKAFQPHGILKDAYVAKKKDSRGNFFGFVRYEGVTDVEATLRGMNSVKIFEAKVSVCLAKYDKFHQRFEHVGVGRTVQPMNVVGIGQPGRQPELKYVPVKRNGPLYSDVVTGTRNNVKADKKTIEFNGKCALYPNHCIMRSVIGEVVDVEAVGRIRSMLDNGGYHESPVSYIGGLRFMIVFKEKRLALEFIRRQEELWSEVLTSATLWEGKQPQYQRLVWIKITGIPIQLRDNELFNKVGEKFGKVVKGAEFSWDNPDNADGICAVLSESGLRLNEEVELLWDGKSYSAWIIETENDDFSLNLQHLTEMNKEFPADSEASVFNGDDEMEEGELREEGVNAPVMDIGNEPENDRVMSENEKSPTENEVHGGEERLHGEKEYAVHMEQNTRKSNDGSEKLIFSGKQQMSGSVLGFNIGLNKGVGHGTSCRSRKRPRQARSPSHEYQDEVWAWDINTRHDEEISVSLNLNKPVAQEDDFKGEENEGVEISRIPDNQMQSDATLVEDTQVIDGHMENNPAIDLQSGQADIAVGEVGKRTILGMDGTDIQKEMEQTIRAGQSVGFHMENFQGQVTNLINGERGQNGFQ